MICKATGTKYFSITRSTRFVVGLVILFFCTFANASDYFILPFNKNSFNGDGTSEKRPNYDKGVGAWNGFQMIKWSNVKPGDTLFLVRGNSYFEMLDVKADGESTRPIKFNAFGSGKNPVITGGKKLSQKVSDWKYNKEKEHWYCERFVDRTPSNGIYSAAIIDGIPLERARYSDFTKFYGQFANSRFKNTIFKNAKPWLHEISVSVLPYNLRIARKSHLEFSNIDFMLSNGWTNPQSGNIQIINGSHHIKFRNCRIRFGSLSGIWVVASNYISFIDCEISENYCTGAYFRAGSSYATIQSCKIFRNGRYLSVNNHVDSGALLMGGSGIGTGHKIENNEIFDNGRETVTDRVDGSLPEGKSFWDKYVDSIWKKDLSKLKRWSGHNITQGVHFLGSNGSVLVQAKAPELCNTIHPWFWDRKNECLFYYSAINPNKTKKKIEIAWNTGTEPAISLWGITNSEIKNNKITNNYSSGIGAMYKTSEKLLIIGNTITNNLIDRSKLRRGLKYGIGISGQGKHIIKNNVIRCNGGTEMNGDSRSAGLLIAASSISPNRENLIENNIIESNGGYQISWYRYLKGNVFHNSHSNNNVISGNYLIFFITAEYNDLTAFSKISSYEKHSVIGNNDCSE